MQHWYMSRLMFLECCNYLTEHDPKIIFFLNFSVLSDKLQQKLDICLNVPSLL